MFTLYHMKYFLTILLSITTISLHTQTRKEVYEELIKLGIKFPDVVIRQAIKETDCGLTGVGKTKNNIFGFRTSKGYKVYESWRKSLIDYRGWQNRRFSDHMDTYHKDNSTCDYYHFILHIGYVDGLKNSERGRKYVNDLKKINPFQ